MTALNEETVRTARRRAVVASAVGTSVEWYDFFLYGTASALVFPKLFFPGSNPFVGVLASFTTQFVGFAARPIGAAIFGHFGDRLGRKATLVTTLLLMGVATFLIGCLPGYESIGVLAPVLLVVLRILQGIGVGGEWGGSVLLSMEWGERSKRGLMASVPQLGVPIGLLLSTGAVKLMSSITGTDFGVWGWRVPFLVSVVLVVIGLYVRLRVLESPEFVELRQEKAVLRLPVWQAIRRYPREILCAALLRMSEQAPFYLFVTFVLTYGTTKLKLNQDSVLGDTMVAAAIGLVSVPLFGWLSDRIGRRLVYGMGIVATAVYAFPYFGLLDTKAAGLVLVGIVVSLIVHDMQYGPQAALIAETFDRDVRYSAAGIGYHLASVVAGGPAPLIAAAILKNTGSSTWISMYIIGCCVVSMIALLALPRAQSVAK
ncbi:MFS transporter [Actinocrispum wychmicini]|uniref:Metabolite-proton symporter n=1 Tax=Actinocrispum wychmicini TaxID=1213861 RepID=A0A4R2IT55_9PSEU|nr:MFS transporter [Actinocrispum wychmicini]TCO47278.1 metabolite-proton symporter [Actinocrispum wychmicini]